MSQILPNIPWKANLSPVKNYCSRLSILNKDDIVPMGMVTGSWGAKKCVPMICGPQKTTLPSIQCACGIQSTEEGEGSEKKGQKIALWESGMKQVYETQH